MKKYAAVTGRPVDSWRFMKEVNAEINLEHFSFSKSAVLDHLFREIENAYCLMFLDGDRVEAGKVLKSQDLDAEEHYGAAELSGLFMGVCTTFLLLIVRILYYNTDNTVLIEISKIYYAIGLFFLISWLFVIHAKVWDQYRINYRFILGIDHHESLHSCQYSALIGLMSAVYLAGVFTSLYIISADEAYVSPIYHPCLLLSLFTTLLLWPIRLDPYQKSVFWLSRVLLKIATAPYYTCLLKDFFIADICVSLSYSFRTLGLLLFYVLNGGPNSSSTASPATWYITLFQLLPYYWRAVQCLRRYFDMSDRSVFPHLINFCKYAISLSLVVMDSFISAAVESNGRTVLIFTHVVSSLFSLTWDIFMDFGLLWEPCIPGHEKLREPILFRPQVYWVMLCLNAAARFLWVLSYISPTAKFQYLSMVLALAELLRRFQWIFFRIEYEHINNCSALRVVNDVKLQSVKFLPNTSGPKRVSSTMKGAMVHISRAWIRRASELFYADMAESTIRGLSGGKIHSETLHGLIAEEVASTFDMSLVAKQSPK